MSDIIEGEIRDRLGESFTSPYPEDDAESEWNVLLTAISNEFEEIEEVSDTVRNAKFVDDALGQQLDKLATLFQIERETGEDDPRFRTRIKARLRSQLASGTNEDIRTTASALLNADTSLVSIIEPDDDARPSVNVIIPVDNFSEIETPGDVWNEVLDSVAAVGVDLSTIVFIGEYLVSVSYSSTENQTLIVDGDFHGSDLLNGTGAFGAGDADDVFGQTETAYGLSVEVSDAGHSTVSEYSTSALGAGELDGEADEADVTGFTSADAFAVVLSAVTGNAEVETGFSESAFGAGLFDGAADDTNVFSVTGISATFTVSWQEATSSATTSDGFGSGSFDGADNFD